MKKLTFDDLKVDMFVKTHQSKNVSKRIIAIGEHPFHVTISQSVRGDKDARFYSETLHWKNLYQAYIDGIWVDFED